jgi:hypothetical protein
VEPAPKRIGISERDWDNFEPKLIELLHLIDLAFLNADRLRVKRENIHGEPYTGIAEWWWFLMSRLGGFNDFPIVDLEEFFVFWEDLSNRIVEYQTRPERDKGAVNVNRVWVSRKVHGMYSKIREVPLNPINSG